MDIETLGAHKVVDHIPLLLGEQAVLRSGSAVQDKVVCWLDIWMEELRPGEYPDERGEEHQGGEGVDLERVVAQDKLDLELTDPEHSGALLDVVLVKVTKVVSSC